MNNSTKIKNLAVMILLTLPLTLQASDVIRYWRDHDKAKREAIYNWKTAAPLPMLAKSVYDIGANEIYLVSKEAVYAKDPRMVMQLADDPRVGMNSSQDLPRLTYWIFMHELSQRLGYTLSTQRLFEENRFEVWEK
jgi:hypothetical protein